MDEANRVKILDDVVRCANVGGVLMLGGAESMLKFEQPLEPMLGNQAIAYRVLPS